MAPRNLSNSSPWTSGNRYLNNSTSYTPTRWEDRYADPYGRPTTGLGFGRGQTTRPQGSTNRNDYPQYTPPPESAWRPTAPSSNNATSQQSPPGGVVTGAPEFSASSETISDNAARRAQLAAALRLLGSQSVGAAERARMQAEAGVASTLRDAFSRSLAARDELSAAGLGYSPRFAGRAQRAIIQDAANQAAALDVGFREALAGLQRRLQSEEVAASGELSEMERAELLEGSRLALSEILNEGYYNTRGDR